MKRFVLFVVCMLLAGGGFAQDTGAVISKPSPILLDQDIEKKKDDTLIEPAWASEFLNDYLFDVLKGDGQNIEKATSFCTSNGIVMDWSGGSVTAEWTCRIGPPGGQVTFTCNGACSGDGSTTTWLRYGCEFSLIYGYNIDCCYTCGNGPFQRG